MNPDLEVLLRLIKALLVRWRINALDVNREMKALEEAFKEIDGRL